jgi:hypothetical protein
MIVKAAGADPRKAKGSASSRITITTKEDA